MIAKRRPAGGPPKKSGLRHRENDTTRQLMGTQGNHTPIPESEIQSARHCGKGDVAIDLRE